MERITEGARRRIARCEHQQKQTIKAVRQGRPIDAEFEADRADSRQYREALRIAQVALPRPARGEGPADGGPERIWGNTVDFVGVAFLQRGVDAARTVGRVAWRDGRPQGTGFLMAPGLFLTNNHVMGSPDEARLLVLEFDYETDLEGRPLQPSRFELQPTEFFVTDDTNDLDYTVVAVGPRIAGPEELETFGYSPLSDAANKHALGEVANIVQHPDGRLKEVVLRENRLVSRLSHVLHYVADTQPGSSGSPVFNNDWQSIALHHWGGPWRQVQDDAGSPVPRFVNEGIRISAIVDELRDRRAELTPTQRERLDRALELGERTVGVPQAKPAPVSDDSPRVHVRSDGTAVWRVPIEISVGVPGLGGAPAASTPAGLTAPPPAAPPSSSEAFRRAVDPSYSNRRGYNDRFLSGHVLPMPVLTGQLSSRLARNLDAEAGDDPFELQYNHFSVYVDGQRGLPLVTACNIDGPSLKSINRQTGQVSAAESLDDPSRPEAREKWWTDPRISPDECGDDDLYTSQQVSPGPGRLQRIFHRGHMVRRLDPCWGTPNSALRAEADTFHFTNCTPQVGRFNSGQTLWQGIENHVLDNARTDNERVTVFTGTVLDDANDPPYRQDVFPGFRVPLQFWKIAVWQDDGSLRALAMLADQSESLVEVPEAAEALDDDEGVRDFVTTVGEIERLTGLDFGGDVRDADLYELVDGPESLGSRKELTDFERVTLDPPSDGRRRDSAARKGGAKRAKRR